MIGFSWYNSDWSIEAITADWEAYPIGHGWKSALENLSWFHPTTKFYKIDDICTAMLFVAKDPEDIRKIKDHTPFSNFYYHISIWHQDLIELHKLGLVSGIKPLTDYQYELLRYKKMGIFKDIFPNEDIFPDEIKIYIDKIEQKHGITRPQKDEYDDEHEVWVDIPDRYIQLTPLGIEKINQPIDDLIINDAIAERIKPLMDIGYYDSAVREASILFELKLIELNKSDQIGKNLVDEHYKKLCTKFGGEDSYLRYYRGLLRCSVSFIRNEYAHSFPITSENRAKRLIKLYSKLFDLTDELNNDEVSTD